MDFFLGKVVPALGAMFVFRAVMSIANPQKEGPDLASSGIMPTGGSSKAGLPMNPHGNLLEKLDYWIIKQFNLDEKLDMLHMQLGRPADLTPLVILRQKQMFTVLAAAMMLFVFGPVGILAGVVGFFLPDLIVMGKVQNRQREILGDFPQFVDLTALLLESGLDYMSAFDKILKVSRKPTDLEMEIEKTLAEVSLGASRKDSLRHLADRVGIQEIRTFVGLIVQSEELGTSLVGLLRDYAADMRFARLNKAEKLAAQAATKMLIPLFVFIFPTVFIMMLGPLGYDMVAGGGLF